MKNLLTTLWDVLVTIIVITFAAIGLAILCILWSIYWIIVLLVIAPVIAIHESDDVYDVCSNYLDFIKETWVESLKTVGYEKREES